MLASHLACPSAALVRPLMRMEVRRPAAWLALAAGAWAAASDAPVHAAATAALAAVAAVGEMPISVRTAIGTALLGVRAAWPAAGLLIAVGLRGGLVGDVLADNAWAATASLIATVATIGVVQARAASAADAASLALAIAATSIGAARAAWSAGIPPLAAGGGTWLTLTALAAGHAGWKDGDGHGAAPLPRTVGSSLSRGILPAGGPVRRLLAAAAMMTTLAAMVAWLVLDRARAAWAFELGMVWFVCLAVPAALLQDGAAAHAAWRPIFASAASGSGRGRASRLGPIRFATEVAMGHAAVLGWPAIVAAAVGMASPGGIWPGLTIAGAVTAAAAALAGLAAISFGNDVSDRAGETALGIAVGLVIAALHGFAWWGPLVRT